MTETVCVISSGTTATFSTSLATGTRTATVAGVDASIASQTPYSVTLSSVPPAGIAVCVTITPAPLPPVTYVNSVNTLTGALTAAQIAASASEGYGFTPYSDANPAGYTSNAETSGTNTGDETAETIKTKLGVTALSGSNTGDQTLPTTLPASDVSAWAKAGTKPSYSAAEIGSPSGSGNSTGTNTGDQSIPTTLPASDVYAWAKASVKPTYTYTEVGAQVAGNYVSLSSTLTKTTDFTVAVTDSWFINNKTGSACLVTLPAAATYPGRSLTFKNMQAQAVTSVSSDVVPVDSTVVGTQILLPVIGNWATVVSDGTNWVTMQQSPNNILLLE